MIANFGMNFLFLEIPRVAIEISVANLIRKPIKPEVLKRSVRINEVVRRTVIPEEVPEKSVAR